MRLTYCSYSDTCPGFSIRTISGSLCYVCDACSSVTGRTVSGTSRSYAIQHLASDAHIKCGIQKADSEAARLAKESKRAADLQTESAVHNQLKEGELPPQLPRPKRPRRFTHTDADDLMTGDYDNLHGVVFSAGHQELDAPKLPREPFRVPMPTDKFGTPADEFDVTAAAIGDDIQRASKLRTQSTCLTYLMLFSRRRWCL